MKIGTSGVVFQMRGERANRPGEISLGRMEVSMQEGNSTKQKATRRDRE